MLETRSGRSLDLSFIDWFSELPRSELVDWLAWVGDLRQTSAPDIGPGVIRPFVSSPNWSPAFRGGTTGWGDWWVQGTCLLALAEEVALTEPLQPAMVSDRGGDPPRGARSPVRQALTLLLELRPLAEAGILHWVNMSTPHLETIRYIDESVYKALERRPRRARRTPEFENAIAEAWACREIPAHQLLTKPFRKSELDQIGLVLTEGQAESSSIKDLLQLNLPVMALSIKDLVGLRLDSASLAEFRNDVQEALTRIPADLRTDRWESDVSDMIAEGLEPSCRHLEREIRRSGVLGRARIAGESVAFSVAGMISGTYVGGAASTAVVLGGFTTAALTATRDMLKQRRENATRKHHLKVLRAHVE